LILATVVWIPCLHLIFLPDKILLESGAGTGATGRSIPHIVEALLAKQIEMWKLPDDEREDVLRMRESNAEWDFIGRTYLVLSLANIALAHPDRKPAYLPLIDRIIDDTLRLEREEGMRHFLMAYANNRPFVQTPERSQFLDGEIALMIAMRQLVEPLPRYEAVLHDRVDTMVARMMGSKTLCTESYPDECWTFCNSVAVAAIKVTDAAHGTDHREFIATWLRAARERLIDPKSGLFISRFGYSDGAHWEGPEGSSIWMIAHCLEILDEDLARDQYERAKRELAGSLMGFGYSREWPRGWEGGADVDVGVVIPLIGASAGGSGMALITAASFRDREYFASLLTSLNFAAFPVESNGRLSYAASNQVGDAVLLYALTLGPAWDLVKVRTAR
jgi:hypothetical protein